MELQESKKYLIDTNILVYAINEDSKYHLQATELLLKIANNPYKACISTQNILEFKRVLTHEKFIKKGINVDTKGIIDVWMSFLEIIYEDKTTWIEYQKLEKKIKPLGNKIFDTWLAATMIANGVDIILTLNTKDFEEIEKITAINPFA